jgi:hypothetical protein
MNNQQSQRTDLSPSSLPSTPSSSEINDAEESKDTSTKANTASKLYLTLITHSVILLYPRF